ncbi:MAG TPA: hypothetical protein VJ994_03020 [Paracoccaceae bacterium]|nr:hypothetical protein [Paracoccaceae bacterium]
MSASGIVLRIAVLIAAVLIAARITAEFRESLDFVVMPHNEIAVHRSIMLATAAFIVLLAIPFVPGAEIGLTMLAVFGPPIAPLVYAATVIALTLSFLVGRLLPPSVVAGGLRALRLARAAEAVETAAPLPREARLARLMQGGAPWLLRLATRFRYVAILIAINVPGNFLIGGGGGIALMAGMSGLFAPLPFVLTVALAVAPVPLAIHLFGG